MRLPRLFSFGLLIAPLWVVGAYADILGSAGSFAVLAGSTVTNTGSSVVNGNLGVWSGTSITGFPPGTVNLPGVLHADDVVAHQAQSDLTDAYTGLAGLTGGSNLTGTDLGGLTLGPGVYFFSSAAQLTGILTLDAQHGNSASWVFKIGSTLTTASSSSVVITNRGTNPNEGLFWQVGSSATLGTGTAFEGNIVALTSITMNTGATILCGRALARNGAVTLDTNTLGTTLDNGCSVTAVGGGLSGGTISSELISAVPEPHALIVPLGFGMVGLALRIMRTRATARVSKI
jgi:type VI secretion system secreted protein VgrG